MKVSVIGTGYVGLVSGVCLAEKGHDVVCVDVDRSKVDRINRGEAPIYEEGLEELLQRNINVRLRATVDLREAVLQSELSLIAVGTPFNGDQIDLTYIRQAAEEIGRALRDKPSYHVIIVKSTVVPGTTEECVLPALEAASGKQAGKDFGVGMNPEFLKEGEAIRDFMAPDRIVMGGIDQRTIDAMDDLYVVFTGADKLRTNPRTAEMIKYAANSLLATMISFSNEIGNLCTAIGNVDVVDVMHGVHLDKRLSPFLPNGQRIKPPFTTYLEAGCGFGGSCFPKDVRALAAHGANLKSPMHLLESVIAVNAAQPARVIDLLGKHFPGLAGVRVAILGLAFKPGTDDMRESPAIPIVRRLIEERAIISAYDPVATHEAQKVFNGASIRYCGSLVEALDSVEAVLLLTRWPEFKELPEMLAQRQPAPVVIDGRRMLDKRRFPRYEGIGFARL